MMLEDNNTDVQASDSYDVKSSLTRKNVLDLRALQNQGKRNTEDYPSKRVDHVLGTLSTEEDEEIQNRKYQTHFYGKRMFIKDLKVSKNYYTVIREMKMGNLSALNRIPEFYAKHLI
jgi:hypothetical protein